MAFVFYISLVLCDLCFVMLILFSFYIVCSFLLSVLDLPIEADSESLIDKHNYSQS